MKKLLAMFLAVLMATTMFAPIAASAEELEETPLVKIEWKSEDGKYKGYDSSENELSGWIKDSYKCWYYFDPSAGNVMKTGWLAGKNEDGLKWYYFKNNGQLAYGWQTIDGQKYYLLEEGYYAGSAVTGTQEIDGINYSFDASGVLIGQSNRGTPQYTGFENFDKRIDEVLAEIIKPGMSEREQLKAIDQWIGKNVTYTTGAAQIGSWSEEDMVERGAGKLADGLKDIIGIGWHSKDTMFYAWAWKAMNEGKGVCNNYANLFCALADALGYRTSVVDFNNSAHTAAIVWFDGRWQIVDPQLDDYKDDGSWYDGGFLKDYEVYKKEQGMMEVGEETGYMPFDWYGTEDYLMNDIKMTFKYQPDFYPKDMGWGNTPEEIYERCTQVPYSRNR